MITTRTSSVAGSPGVASLSAGMATKLPGVYGTQVVPSKYSSTVLMSVPIVATPDDAT